MSSEKENEYFSDGITEEILNALSKIDGLHVIARTSSFVFKNQNIDVREIGNRLNVSLLLEGSIRKSGDIIRITAQLTNTSDGFHIWSETWDRELKNIFIVQDEIAAIIAEKINKDISVDVNWDGHVVKNTDAIDYYLKGAYLQHSWDFNEGKNIIECFEKAIKLDPNLVKAHIGLCNVYTWLSATGNVNLEEGYKKIEYHSKKIIELDNKNPDLYVMLSQKNFWIDWDFPTALNHLNISLNLQPSNDDALKSKGLCLAAMGQVEQALDCLFQSERLNPFGEQINAGIGMIYNYINENEKAIEYIEKNIKICPTWYAQYLDKVDVLCKLQRYNEAWETIKMLEKDSNSPLSISQLKSLYFAYQGKTSEAYKYLENLKKEMEKSQLIGSPDASFISQIYILLGEDDKALEYLEHGINNNATPFLFIKILNYWDHLRNHPRYINAIKKIKYENANSNVEEFKKYKKTTIPDNLANKIENKLNLLMNEDKPYLNPTLNLSDLAELVNITTNQMSQILNEFIGKNFYDYINSFRLAHFLELNKNPKYKQFTLISVAYECGFNSKTTFNTFFKKTMGKPPSDYFKE